IVAYQTAYMKAHYPVQYMTAVLQAESGDNDKIAQIVGECRRIGIEVLPPDVNESFRSFAMVSKPGDKGRIRFGLTAIKNVGEHICEVIYRERKENGQYIDLENFLERIDDKDLNKKSLESLGQAGALDGFGYDRGLLFSNSENILGYLRQHRERKTTNQNSLFSGTDIALDAKVVFKPAPEATLDQKLKWEKDLLGIYLSSHPFAYYESQMKGKLVTLAEIDGYTRDTWVVVGGVVGALKKKITKKGSIMMFATLEDTTGLMELLVFPKTYETTKDLWVDGKILCVVGKTPKEDGDNKIFVEKAYALTRENSREVMRFLSLASGQSASHEPVKRAPHILITTEKEFIKNNADKLKEVLGAYPGTHEVFIHLEGGNIKTQFLVEPSAEMLLKVREVFGADAVRVEG
ncbi:MAG: hypothetical protein KBD29_02070, partial [Candidatus Magasanikbacteria bacterium]|nr:hypothetical protein [Candidatus Magasanikbacteria bacterium]